jgi:hypothetical protein
MAMQPLNGTKRTRTKAVPKRREDRLTKAQLAAGRRFLAESSVKPTAEGMAAIGRSICTATRPASRSFSRSAEPDRVRTARSTPSTPSTPTARSSAEDERKELRHELGTPAEGLDETAWMTAWNSELSRRLTQIERGEVPLLTEEELFAAKT